MARLTIRGNLKIRQLSSEPSTPAAATGAEVGAGTEMTGVAEAEALASMDGWESSASTINVPDVLSLTTGNIPGETTFPTGTLTYYTDDITNARWAAETEGSPSYLLFFPDGDGDSKDYTMFSVEVISRSRALNTGNEAETHSISYAIKSRTEGTQSGATV